jgi:hypothetical protein
VVKQLILGFDPLEMIAMAAIGVAIGSAVATLHGVEVFVRVVRHYEQCVAV